MVRGHRVPHLSGMVGTIERSYRTSEREALHVRLEDGRWQLLWPQEVEPFGEPLGEGSHTDGEAAGGQPTAAGEQRRAPHGRSAKR